MGHVGDRGFIAEHQKHIIDAGDRAVVVEADRDRILAAATSEDDSDFQAGYGACSTCARRDNTAQQINYVPEPDEMKAEVERIRMWQKWVKKYCA